MLISALVPRKVIERPDQPDHPDPFLTDANDRIVIKCNVVRKKVFYHINSLHKYM